MDDTKLEELEKAYKYETDYKIRILEWSLYAWFLFINKSVNPTFDIQGLQPNLGSKLRLCSFYRLRPKRSFPVPSPILCDPEEFH